MKKVLLNIKRLFAYFISFAFIGYVFEVLYRFIRSGVFINRGVLHGPWLPLYGFGGLIILLLPKKLRKNPIYVFFFVALSCSILEYFTGVFLEKTMHMRWWNYSNFFLNINGRVCLKSFIAFGLLGTITLYLVVPILKKIFKLFNSKTADILIIILCLIFFTDLIYSMNNPNTGDKITYKLVNN